MGIPDGLPYHRPAGVLVFGYRRAISKRDAGNMSFQIRFLGIAGQHARKMKFEGIVHRAFRCLSCFSRRFQTDKYPWV
jgi:hypothetical protein